MLGYSFEEMKDLDYWAIYHPDYQELTRQRGEARLRGVHAVAQYEVKLQRKDGSSFDGELSARAVTVEGEPGVLVWVRDVSERRRSEEARKLLATAVEQAAEAIVVTDRGGNIQYVNPAFETITGYTPEEVVGRHTRLLKSGEHDKEFYRNMWETLERGQVWSGRFINRRKDGKLCHEQATISPVRNGGGQIVHFVAVKREITEEVRLGQQLVQAQKMEAIGTLAGGIAHDFNNLLQVILGYSELMLQDRQPEETEYSDLQKILHAGRSGTELVRRLLTFSRKTETKPLNLDLNQRIRQTRKFLERTIPKMINIELALAPNLDAVNADPTQIDQVIMNLAVNARDAMPEGGKFVIKTANVELDHEYAKLHLLEKSGRYVLLQVTDTGSGIEREMLEHIFEPFYTTKGPGEGTGLGLAIVYGIVRQNHGAINCYSEIGRGTTFKIYLPAVVSEPESYQSVVTSPPEGGTETVLLADDDELVRNLGERILKNAGYTVLTARNGREALELYRKERDRIDLVILDLIMPEMGGKKCLEEIRQTCPEAKVLISSGYSAFESSDRAAAPGANGFIDKPYQMSQMLRTVRDVLDEA